MPDDFSPDPLPKKPGKIRRGLKRARAYVWPAGKAFLDKESENNRLRQLLEQSPQAYAIWSDRGESAVSPLLPRWLGTKRVKSVDDVIYALAPSDAAALEGLWQRLDRDGQPFSLRAKTANEERVLGIQAERRSGIDDERLTLFWFSDLTHTMSSVGKVQMEKAAAEEKLHEQIQRLEAVPLPLWVRDASGAIIWCNAIYAMMVESNVEAVLRDQIELMGGKSGSARSMAQRARSERSEVSEKHPLIVKGERKLIQITELPLGAQNSLGLAQDLTALDEMNSEFRRFRASTQELLRALNTGIAIFNPKTELVFFNDAFVTLFPLEEVFLNDKPRLNEIMESLREKRRLPEQADFKAYKKQWLDRFTSLIAPHEEMMHIPGGLSIRMLVVPHPLGGLFMTFEDVTSRLQLESSYNTLIAVQKETIDNLAEGLAVWRSDARLALFNPSYAQMWNLKPKELAAQPHASTLAPQMEKFFTPEDWKIAGDILQQATLSRKEDKGRLNLSDGRIIEYATIPLPDGGMLNRFNDISDTLKVERALREKNAALEQAERLKLDFLANVSYQLRTPLNAMMGFSEVLEKQYFGPLNERQMEYARGMIDAGEKLIVLINDILDLSTIEAGYLALQIRPLEVLPMIKGLYELTHEWARGKKIEMALDCPTNIGTVEVDERRIKQVMLNLISNAIKFTPEGGKITLKVERREKGTAFIIDDTGIGISQEDQEKIFSPFVQLQHGQRHAGAGLGLSLVKSIIELHGGEVHLVSAPNQGTTVTCMIPARKK
jgi:signal transduction histidine kinase